MDLFSGTKSWLPGSDFSNILAEVTIRAEVWAVDLGLGFTTSRPTEFDIAKLREAASLQQPLRFDSSNGEAYGIVPIGDSVTGDKANGFIVQKGKNRQPDPNQWYKVTLRRLDNGHIRVEPGWK